MAFLLCSFASERSQPEKIRSWISYLETAKQQRVVTPEQRQTVEILLEKAHRWQQQD